MSHVVTIKTQIKDVAATAAACNRLGLAPPLQGTAQLFSGQVNGVLVQFPGWQYPAVIDVVSGEVRFDNYEGQWGEQKHLDRFLQAYAVEKARIEARKKGYTVIEQSLQDGSVRLTIGVGG